MELLIATILVSMVIAVYLTALISRRGIAQSRKPSFWLVPFATFSGPIIILFGGQGRDLFTERFWHEITRDHLPGFAFFLCAGALINIGPVIITAIHYRNKLRS